MLTEAQNTGVLWKNPEPQDDIASGESRIVYEENIADGQWDDFMPSEQGEIQISLRDETNTCTNHACSNPVDAQINLMIARNKIPTNSVIKLEQAGFIVNDRFNTSERDNAILSGTNGGLDPNRPKGNYLYKPWDSARNDGMCPEKLLPFSRTMTLQEFFNPILSADQKAEIAEARQLFKSIFLIQYEIVPTDIKSILYHKKQAPLSIISGVCKGWGSAGIVPACYLNSGHATAIYGDKENEYLKDFDSYNPLYKKLAWDYKIGYAIKGVVTLRDAQTELTYKFTKQMREGDRSEDVKKYQIALFLQGVLQDSEWKTREAVQKWGGYFGENTKEATKRLQAKYKLNQSGEVLSKTLNLLNSIYNK
jgi:hypothetical protein